MSVASHTDSPRALITGLKGFTGRYLYAELRAAGYQVFGTVHTEEEVGTDLFKVDLCDRAALSRVLHKVEPDVVAHLAAISFVAHEDVAAIYQTNVVGTRNLLEALSGLPKLPRSVLLASSANIYGNSDVEVIDESVAPQPANDYAVSKLAMEYVARLWMNKLPITIVRPFNYTGAGQAEHFLLPKIVNHFKRGDRIIELGNIDIERDFSDVRMVATAYRGLIERMPAGETFNLCSGRSVSIRQVLSIMTAIAGYEIQVRVNPSFVRASDVKRLRGDCSKLTALLGDIAPVPLEQTLRWMFEA